MPSSDPDDETKKTASRVGAYVGFVAGTIAHGAKVLVQKIGTKQEPTLDEVPIDKSLTPRIATAAEGEQIDFGMLIDKSKMPSLAMLRADVGQRAISDPESKVHDATEILPPAKSIANSPSTPDSGRSRRR